MHGDERVTSKGVVSPGQVTSKGEVSPGPMKIIGAIWGKLGQVKPKTKNSHRSQPTAKTAKRGNTEGVVVGTVASPPSIFKNRHSGIAQRVHLSVQENGVLRANVKGWQGSIASERVCWNTFK